MNNLKTLRNAIQNLKGKTITERTTAFDAIRVAFQDNHALETFATNDEGTQEPKNWIILFQALFQYLLLEKQGKSTSSADNRIQQVAVLVRELTARGAHLFNRKVTEVLYVHMLQTMISKNTLYPVVSEEYIKAIKALLSYPAHLDHLKTIRWLELVQLGFNVILGDPLNTVLAWDPNEPAPSPAASAISSEGFVEDDDADGLEDAQKLGKRHRQENARPSSSKSNTVSKAEYNPVAATAVQIEFNSLITLLIQSSYSPVLFQSCGRLPDSLLNRCQRFLEYFPPDSTLYNDFLQTLLTLLSQLSVNKKEDVSRFARHSWKHLVGLWRTKNKRLKETLVAILHRLLPYVTAPDRPGDDLSNHNWSEGVWKLWRLLDAESLNRRGSEGLPFDAIRLELNYGQRKAFVAKTYRAGLNFNTDEALTWAILELQADCAEKLYQFSESHLSGLSTPRVHGKRIRVENPINSLLRSIQEQSSPQVRTYRLQVLLFIIDRHWDRIYDTLQQSVMDQLNQWLAADDSVVQSWVFTCLAAVAYEDAQTLPTSSSQSQQSLSTEPVAPRDEVFWGPLWTLALRRANVPAVSRAACHLAQTLVTFFDSLPSSSNHVLLSSRKVLGEVESFTRDIDVQGPSHPYESVCMLLMLFLKIANQDVRLYRMQFEDKVLSWLLDSWSLSDDTQMRQLVMKDILSLIEAICGYTRRCELIFNPPLPDCPIVHTLVEEENTRLIRDLTLYARLMDSMKARKPVANINVETNAAHAVTELTQPRGRERKISGFLMKALESHFTEWELAIPAEIRLRPEKARQALDAAVAALWFDALVTCNGIQSNRRVIQSAFKIITLITPQLARSAWTLSEKASILLALEPLVSYQRLDCWESDWTAIIPPDEGTGMRARILKELSNEYYYQSTDPFSIERLRIQRAIWRHPDVIDGFTHVMETFRDVLRQLIGDPTSQVVEADDGFGRIKNAPAIKGGSLLVESSDTIRCVGKICIMFLSRGPFLQSTSGEATRDKDLAELLLRSLELRPDRFLLLYPLFLQNIRLETLTMTSSNFNHLLEELSDQLQLYACSKSESWQRFATLVLDSTLHLWISNAFSASVKSKVRQLCHWLSTTLNKGGIASWRGRDAVALFFDRYLSVDPSQSFWQEPSEDDAVVDPQNSPVSLLQTLVTDDDIRVRFRAAVLNAKTFAVARRVGYPEVNLYTAIYNKLDVNISQYETILTRLLTFGNIMVASAAVRRGAYWHIVETSIQDPHTYAAHIESILRAVSDRMGLKCFSTLFETYGSQLVISIRDGEHDFHRVPPPLLGYESHKEAVQASFTAFTPAIIVAGDTKRDVVDHGMKMFQTYCTILQIRPADGILSCFGDIVAWCLLSWHDQGQSLESKLDLLVAKTMMEDRAAFESVLKKNIDAVAASVLCTLSDESNGSRSPMLSALQGVDNSRGGASAVVDTFCSLMRHRVTGQGQPQLPSFPADSVVHVLAWLVDKADQVDSRAITYHVLHILFARIHQSPLVHEQIRIYEAVSLWVAYNHSEFEDLSLSHTLIHGGCLLMAQSDLVLLAQSLLDWAFGQYCLAGKADPRFPDIFTRTCCLAYDYSRDEDPTVAAIGTELLKWMDHQALEISSKSRKLKDQILTSLPAWPHEFSSALSDLFEEISPQKLSSVLSNHRITTDKFRVVRQLRHHDVKSFGSREFWKLKESIPSMNELRDEDVRSFAELLVLCKGSISSFGDDQLLAKAARNKEAAEQTIVRALLIMLEDHNPIKLHAAYRTLRSVMTKGFIPPTLKDYNADIELLKTYPRLPTPRTVIVFDDALSSESLLDACRDFPRWIGAIAVLLSDTLAESNLLYAQLRTILLSDATFAEKLLPVLVWSTLAAEIKDNHCVNMEHSSRPRSVALSRYFASVLCSGRAVLECRRAIVATVLHLLDRQPPEKANTTALAYEKWLHIDFSLLAETAISCGSYTTALLFLEVAANNGKNVGVGAEQMMYEIYSHIDEPDGFYGIKDQNHQQFLINSFHHERQWDKAFRFHGAALEAGSTDGRELDGMLQAFHSFGFNHLASASLSGTNSTSPVTYHLGWRTETWDLPDYQRSRSSGSALYLALRAVHRERSIETVDGVLRNVLVEEMQYLRALGSENIAEIREVVQSLMCLSQVSAWLSPPVQAQLASRQIPIDGFKTLESGFDFADAESIMATRISLIRSSRQKEERQQIGSMISDFAKGLLDIEKQCLLRISSVAREARQNQIALNAIIRAQRLEPSFEISEEFSNVLWLHNEEKRAVQLLTDLRNSAPSLERTPIQIAMINARLGSWTAEACLHKPSYILKEFFDPATSLTLGTSPSAEVAEIYHQCAVFAQHQYYAIVQSPDLLRRKVYLDLKTKHLKRLQETRRSTDDVEVRQSIVYEIDRATKVKANDESIYAGYIRERNNFLVLAIDMYSRCLEVSDVYDGDAVIRLCSLWLANFDGSDADFLTKVRDALHRIPSRKFIFLAHQLSARLSHVKAQKSQRYLQSLIIRMCKEHPFHSIYQVFCLLPTETSTDRSADRGEAAKEILNCLRNVSDETTRERVLHIERLSAACLQWAEHKFFTDKKDKHLAPPQNKSTSIPRSQAILSIQNLKVPALTSHTPLDPTLRYDNIATIKSYEKAFVVLGGINLPKVSVCLTTDGKQHKQLFKGDDDLRQDAVMEQVFELCNNLLGRDRETKRRRLLVRDYKVIPLAATAGVIEFVDNTTTLSEWLESAHKRYAVGYVPSTKDMRDTMNQVRSEDVEVRIKKFKSILQRVKPVMRHYFTEAHRKPSAWFAMRLNYVRSVATTSIVGHVLGLGDRHVSNILIDRLSGELIHIDLGIAFDQGKLLRVPETVPFRMTGDMVDGMGISGTDGVFQRCAEETLRVLREGSEVIMTVLEVFRHDPLHSWTANEDKMNRAQPEIAVTEPATTTAITHGMMEISLSSGVADEAADRALSSVARKLSKTLSVTSTVSGLIAEARDPANLGVIFPGWSPFL